MLQIWGDWSGQTDDKCSASPCLVKEKWKLFSQEYTRDCLTFMTRNSRKVIQPCEMVEFEDIGV